MVPDISQQEFQQLVAFSHPNCVSLYIPTDRTNPDPRLNSIRFKNSVNKAITQLAAIKVDKATSDSLDRVCEELLADSMFWKEQQESLAVFVAGDWIDWYTLPIKIPDLLMVADHAYVVPLAPIVAKQQVFFVLELDRDHTKMWRSNHKNLEVVEVANLPKSVDEVTGVEANERQFQFHTGTDSPRGDKRAAAFYGGSSWKDDKDRYLERFLKAVDKAVTVYLKETGYPLILSGVEELVVTYRQITRSSQVRKETLPKIADPNRTSYELHRRGLAIMEKIVAEKQDQALTAFFEEPRTERRLTLLPEILRQTTQGKIGTLFVAENARLWGTFDAETLTLIQETTQLPRSAELYNLAALLTLRNGGSVIVLPAEKIPGGSLIAAVSRY